MQHSERIGQILDSMSLAEKVGQVFIFTWENEQQAKNDLRLNPGGYVRIYSDAFSVARQTLEIQQLARVPLIIAADLERGIGGTIGGPLEIVTCMALGATGNEKAAYDSARMIGEEARAMGVNMNYAPVVDVNCNPANPVINTRSFGGDPDLVGRLGVAFAQGLQDAGIAACGKHFPGHGNTGIDSHSMLGSIDSDLRQMEEIELSPFKTLIDSGVDAIMSAHLLAPALEPDAIPATLSRRIMTDLLREKLGFTGLAISDAMEMKAVASNFDPISAIAMAVNAGCDQLIMPENNEIAVSALLNAVKRGEVTEQRLDEAVLRILTLKEKRGILNGTLPELDKLHLRINTPAHVARAREIAAESITLVKDEAEILPLRPHQKICCINISNGDDSRANFLEPKSFSDQLRASGRDVISVDLCELETHAPQLKDGLTPWMQETDVIIIAGYVNVRLYSGTIELPDDIMKSLQVLQNIGKPIVLASFGSPYLINQFPQIPTYLCAYGATQPSQQAMADAISGRIQCTGKLPVALK